MGLRVIILVVCLTVSAVTHAKLIDLSCEQIREFVDGHNSRRLELAQGEVAGHPAASEMKSMVWDDELAEKAAKWASRNEHIHNPDKSIGSGRFSTGENIYWFSTTDDSYNFDTDQALKSWFDEYKDWSYKPLDANDFGGPIDIGHYTQMAWSDSTYLGCAISQSRRPDNGWNSFFVVCNYGPAGNFIGEAPYKADGGPSNTLICGIDDCSQQYGDRCS